MIYCLTAMGFAVNYKTPAFFGTACTFGYFLCLKKQLSHEFCIGSIHFHNITEMLFGNYKKMHRRLRVQIMKSQDLIVFVQLFRRNLAFHNFTKNAVVHDPSITELKGKPQWYKNKGAKS